MIKILFLAANPLDTDRLRLDEEARAIDAALRQAEFCEQFILLSHWAVRINDLQELLLRHQPDIVHFSGHGSTASEIILHNEQGKAVIVPAEALSHLFKVLKDNIRCVVLSACYSDDQATSIAQHIDCVVGMSDAISDEAARNFATAFYRALGYGRSVQTAFDLGCSQIDLSNLKERHKPKLLTLHTDPTQLVFTEAIASPSPGETIHAEIGNEAKNVNVGHDISTVNIGNVTGGIHGSTIAGRDVNQTTIRGNVRVKGDFISGDKTVQGDEVRGNKITINRKDQ